MGVGEPPQRRTRAEAPPARRSPWDPPEPPPVRAYTTVQKIIAGVFIGALYTVGMVINGEVLPGVVGGVLAGLVTFLVLREVEDQRRRRARQRRS